MFNNFAWPNSNNGQSGEAGTTQSSPLKDDNTPTSTPGRPDWLRSFGFDQQAKSSSFPFLGQTSFGFDQQAKSSSSPFLGQTSFGFVQLAKSSSSPLGQTSFGFDQQAKSSYPAGLSQPSIFGHLPPSSVPSQSSQPFTFHSKKACHDRSDRSLIVKSIYNLTKVYRKVGGEGFDADLLQLLESSILELTESLSETCDTRTQVDAVAKVGIATTRLFGSGPEKVEAQHSEAQKASEGAKQQQMEAEKDLEALKQQKLEVQKSLEALKQQQVEALEVPKQRLDAVRRQCSYSDKHLVRLRKQCSEVLKSLEGLQQQRKEAQESLEQVKQERCGVEKSLESVKQRHSEADKSLQALVKACEYLEQQRATIERKLQAGMTN